MQKQMTMTISAAVAANSNAAPLVVEVGFVPNRIYIINRTQLTQYEWNENLTSGHFYQRVAAGDLTKPTSGGPTLIDGSNKNPLSGETTMRSFGFTIPGNLALFTDTENDVLDITVFRDDAV